MATPMSNVQRTDTIRFWLLCFLWTIHGLFPRSGIKGIDAEDSVLEEALLTNSSNKNNQKFHHRERRGHRVFNQKFEERCLVEMNRSSSFLCVLCGNFSVTVHRLTKKVNHE